MGETVLERWHDREAWLTRCRGLLEGPCTEPVVFLVGSGLSLNPAGPGVWGVSQVVQWLRTERKLVQDVADPVAAYQQGLMELSGLEGQPGVDRLIRRAVLAASKLSPAEQSAVLQRGRNKEPSACEDLQRRNEHWHVPPGVEGLARLIRALLERKPEGVRAPCVVTTNFDGLIEVALSRLDVPFERQVIVKDLYPRGDLRKVQLLHVHGHWCRGPTMHTPWALEQQRAGLEQALRARCDGADVYVMGYGGWKDVAFETLVTMIKAQRSETDVNVVWAFFKKKDPLTEAVAKAGSPEHHIVTQFEGVLGSCQVNFYAGIDVHRDLPALFEGPPADGGLEPDPLASQRAAREKLNESIRAELDKMLRNLEAAGFSVKAALSPIEKLLDQPGLLDLCPVVGALCQGLKQVQRPLEQRHLFAGAARAVIDTTSRAVIEAVPEPSFTRTEGDAYEPVRVEVATLLLVEIVMARSEGRDPELVRGALGPMGRNAANSGGRDPLLSPERVPIDFGEQGMTEDGYVIAFERCLWHKFFPTRAYTPPPKLSDCIGDRRMLYSALDAQGDLASRVYVVLHPKALEQGWEQISRRVPGVVFVQHAGDEPSRLVVDEYRLAHLIQEFLRLVEDETL